MRFVSLCCTLLTKWRTGRWFLSASLVFLAICSYSPDVILRYIVAPQADFSHNGWWMHFYEPSRPLDIHEYSVFLPAAPIVALNPDFIYARGYMVWRVPVDSQFRLQFLVADNATLSIDGQDIAHLTAGGPEGKSTEKWIALKKGIHLVQTKFQNRSGSNSFTLKVAAPPKMRFSTLMGKDVAALHINSMDKWWRIMEACRSLRGFAWAITSFSALCLLLPLTMTKRWVSVPVSLCIVLAPALILPYRAEREPYIGEMIHQQLRQKNPDFVFIGNSMLWSRIDDTYLEKLLGGKKVFSIVNFGGLSAVHYLSFKYLFLPSGIRPKRVFIFFRGNQFILPRARTTDDPFVEKIIQRITPSPDPVYEQIVHGRSRSATDIVYDMLVDLFPLSSAQEVARKKLNDVALGIASPWIQNETNILTRINKRFSLTSGSLRAGAGTESLKKENGKNSFDLYGHVEDSFLPHILRLASKRGIPLAFIRVQERPTEKGARPDSPEMRQYMHDLRQYLEEHGAALYDFTGDPELPLSAYHDGDHIKDQKKYTELFYRRVGDLLK